MSGEDFPTLDGVYLQSGAGKGCWWGEGDRAPYLLSSLNHWNSAEGTAEASHCRVPFCPTGTPVPLASDMYGGSAERRRSMPFNSTFKNENKQTKATNCLVHGLCFLISALFLLICIIKLLYGLLQTWTRTGCHSKGRHQLLARVASLLCAEVEPWAPETPCLFKPLSIHMLTPTHQPSAPWGGRQHL